MFYDHVRHERNESTMIYILGFQFPQKINFVVFFLLLIIYFFTIFGNLLIITLVSCSKTLQSPMYFFLCQLAVSDILLITDIFPNMLHTVLAKETKISLSGCISQFYVFAVIEVLECSLLALMAYDRYLAICKPLHYSLIMNHRFCWMMISTCWVLSFLVALIHTVTVSKLQFCGPYVIDHFFCDLDPILGLICSDTTVVYIEILSVGALVVVSPFVIIIVSYVYIILTIFKIPSITGRKKVFSTCSSHLTGVSIYYGSIECVYLIPNSSRSLNMTKYLSLLYTVGTPLINPIIYSLRNTDLKKKFKKLINTSINKMYF